MGHWSRLEVFRFTRLALAYAVVCVFLPGPRSSMAGEVHDLTAPPKRERELLIRFKPDAKSEEKAQALQHAIRSEALPGVLSRQGGRPGSPDLQRITLDSNVNVATELARLSASRGVAFVEPNYAIKISEQRT